MADHPAPPQEPDLSLRRLWKSGYQVILSYDSQLTARHPELWPAIPYWWANCDTAQGVISYMEWHKDRGRPGEFVTKTQTVSQENVLIFPVCFISRLLLRDWPEPHSGQELHHQEPEGIPADTNLQKLGL